MKASFLEFRLRIWIMVALLGLGFWSPWLGSGSPRGSAWLWLAAELSRTGFLSFTQAFAAINSLLIAFAAFAVCCRVWGTAYLGAHTVIHGEMKAGQVLADGPYRHVRNPLYIGSWFTLATVAVVAPVSGAAFVVVALSLFLFRLILGEEAFLTSQLGEPYLAFCRAVPRLIPSLNPRVPAGGRKPRWAQSVVAELFPIGALFSFAVLSWQYSGGLLERALLISFGISLVARAIPAFGWPDMPARELE